MMAILLTWFVGILAFVGIIVGAAVALTALVWLFGTEDGQGLIGVVTACICIIAVLLWLTTGATYFGQWILAGGQ